MGADDHVLDHDVESAVEEDLRHRQHPCVSQRQLAQCFLSGVGPHVDASAGDHRPDGVAWHADAALESLREQPRDGGFSCCGHSRDHEQRHGADHVSSAHTRHANLAVG
jgi:hypothetical protein